MRTLGYCLGIGRLELDDLCAKTPGWRLWERPDAAFTFVVGDFLVTFLVQDRTLVTKYRFCSRDTCDGVWLCVSVLLSVLQRALYSFRERLAYFVARRTVINAQEIAQQVPGLCYSNRDGPSVTVLQG